MGMGETHGKDVGLDMSSMIDVLNELRSGYKETKKATSDPIDIKANSNGIHTANEELNTLLKKLKEIKQSKNLQKYFTDAAAAQEKLTKAYEQYQAKLKSGNEKQINKATADLARNANAFTALGGNPDDVNKKIKSITADFMKKNNPDTGWLFGVENFKEVFAIMQQIESLAPGTFFKNVANEAERAGESVTQSAKKVRDSIKNDSIAKNIFDSDEGEKEANKLVELLDKIWGKVSESNKNLSANDAIDFVTAFQKLNYYLEQTPRKMDDARASLDDFKKFFEDIYDFIPENQRSELTDFMLTSNGELDQAGMLRIAMEFWEELARNINQASDALKDFYSNQFVGIPKLTEEQQIYRSIVEQLREYYDLKKKIASGNKAIVSKDADGRFIKVDSKDTRKGKDGNYHSTQAGLKRLLIDYDLLMSKENASEESKNNLINRIAAYTNALDESVDAQKLFGEAHAELFTEVAIRIKSAEEAMDAFNKAYSLMRTISLGVTSLGANVVSQKDFKGIEEALSSGGVEGGLKYLVETMGMKLPEAAREAADAMDNEASSEKKAGDAAEESANSDDKATESKKKKAKAAEESAKASEKEAKAEQDAAKKREEATKTSKYNAEQITKMINEASDRVYKNEIHNPNGAKTATDYIDHFRTRTTKTSYDKNGELQIIESTKENYVELEKQIQKNDKAIAQLTKDMLLNAKLGADTSAWKNQIDALEEYNRVLLDIRNNGWVNVDDYFPQQRHADVFDADRLKAQEKNWEGVIAAAQKRLKGFIESTESLATNKLMPGFATEVDNLHKALVALSGTQIDFKNSDIDVVRQQVEAFLTTLAKLETVLNNVNSRSVQDEVIPADIKDIQSLDNKIMSFLDNNTAASKKFKDALESVHLELRRIIDTGGQLSKVELDELAARANEVEAEVRQLHQTGNSFFRSFTKQLKSSNAQFLATYFSLQDIVRYLREAFNTIEELDYALVDLRKTTTMTNAELNDFYYEANVISKKMGVTTKAIIEQAASWSRLGYSTKEASAQMAELSSQFASISPGMSTEDAQIGLVSLMKAYKIETDQVERELMDNINVLGNKFAETNDDIIEGMKRAGATLSAIGTSPEDSFALFTGAQEIIQNAETVGTALKTLSLRIRGFDEETEEMSDDVINAVGKVASLTKVASNNFAGVSLWADAEQTQYRSLREYLGDIAKIWDEIDAKSQTDLLNNLFGKRGASVGSSILKNFDQVEKALVEMENAGGAADAEMEIIRESIDYKLNALQQTWVGIIQNMVERGDIGKLIDMLTSFSETIGKIADNIGLFGTVIAGIGLFQGAKHFKDIKQYVKGLTEIVDVIETYSNTLSVAEDTTANTLKVIHSLDEVFGSVEGPKEFYEEAQEFIQRVDEADIFKPLSDSAENAMEEIVEDIVDSSDVIEDAVEEIGQTASEALHDKLVGSRIFKDDSIDNAYSTLLEETGQLFHDSALDIGTDTVETITDTIESLADGAESEDIVASILNLEEFPEIVDEFTGPVEEFSNAIEVTDGAIENLSNITDEVAEGLELVDGGMLTTGSLAEGTTVSVTKLQVALTKLFTNPWTWVIAGLAAIAGGIYATIKANDELRKSAKELGKTFASAEKDIDEYKDKIESLYETINDENSSYEDSKTAREQLLTIQDELIEKYGSEANAINDITEAINGEIDALDRLTDRQWTETINEFNEQNLPGWDWMNRMVHSASDNVGVMLKDMEHYSKTVNLGTNRDFAKRVAELYGGNYYTNANNQHVVQLQGDLDTIYNQLLGIQELARKSDVSDGVIAQIGKQASDAKELIETYSQFYNQYVLNERVFGTQYEQYYSSLLDEYQKYRKALISADSEGAEKSKEAILKQYQQLYDSFKRDENGNLSAEDLGIYKTLSNLVPELQNELNKNVLKVHLELDTDEVKEEQTKVVKAIQRFSNEEALVNYIEGSNSSLDESYQFLIAYAQKYGVTLEELIALQRELGALSAFKERDVRGIADKYTRSNGYKDKYDDRGIRQYDADFISAVEALDEGQYDVLQVFNERDYRELKKAFARIQKETNGNISKQEAYNRALEETIRLKKEEVKATEDASKLDQANFSEQVNKLDDLQKAYSTFAQNVANKETKINLDISDVEGLRETFGEIDGFDFDQFELTVTSDTSSVEDIQKAFDSAATAYANHKIALQEITDENKEMIRTQLEMEGITKDSAQKFVDAKLEQAKATKYAEEKEAEFNVKMKESERIANLTREQAANELKQLEQGGGVQLTLRPVIDTSELEKAGWKDTGDGIATLFTSTFSNEDNTVAMNFTPILADENGHYLRTLSPQELTDYAKDVINGVREDDLNLQIGAKFVGDDAIEQAEDAAQKIHKIQAVYYNYTGDDQFASFIEEDTYALMDEAEQLGVNVTALAAYRADKLMASENPLNTTADRAQLLALVQMLGVSEEEVLALVECINLLNSDEIMPKQRRDTIMARIQQIVSEATEKAANISVEYDYGNAIKDAGKGGSDAGNAYVEAFEKELEALEKQRDAGILSEKEFLDRYRALIEKYFKDVDGYGEEYAERMADYFNRVISYYESVFSAVGTLLDKRISAAQEGKEAAVDALNAEKDAALAAYDAQLDAIDALIDAKQDEIDAIQDEIDRLQDEHDARQRNIDLQKAQYELQKAQNQRTKLIYKDGQMVYETDTDAIREAKQQVEDAEFENAVAALEKQKSLLEDQLEALQDQREEIEKAREAAEKYYDQLISDTEKYWDSIIDALEKQKSKWEELAEIKEIANAYALIQEAGEDLGYSVEDILNDVPGAFEAFRDAYIRILQEANSENKNFLDGLAHATSEAKGNVNSALSEIAGKASEVDQALAPLGDVSSKVEDTATALGNVATNSGTAATNTDSLSKNLESAAGTSEDISKIDSSVQSIAGASLDSTVKAFENLAKALDNCAKALGIGEGEISSFESAIKALSNVSLGNDTEGAIGSFNKLAGAVSAVTSAIGTAGASGGSTDTAESASEDTTSAGTGGLIEAIEGVKEATKSYIGESSSAGGDGDSPTGGDTEGGGTAISDFDALYTAVGNVVKSIGNTKDDYSEDGTTLVNAIKGLPIVGAEAIRGADGIIKMFEELLQAIKDCVAEMDTLLEKINGFKASGGYGLLEDVKYTGNVHVNGHKDGNVHGNAYASGKLGLKKSENALVGELGQELVYNPETGTYRTVGDHGPEITRLHKGDLIFNAEQTKAIIKHGKHGGNSYANGNGLMPLSDAEMNMFKTMGNALVGIKADTSQMLEPIKAIAQNISNVTTNNTSTVININGTSFTVSGVTGESVMHMIQDQFAGMISNAYQRAMKQ